MENHSFNERHSLTGNSGLLGLTSIRTKLQPVRVKQLLEMYGSDEEDSEERGKDSDNESDSDDIQPLPDDDLESPEAQSQPSKESEEGNDDRKISPNEKIVRQQFEEQHKPQENSPPQVKQEKQENNMHFTSNFVSDEPSHMKLENHRSESLPAESAAFPYFSDSSARKSSIEGSRQQFEEQPKPQENSPPQVKQEKQENNMHFTSNFVSDEPAHNKLENHRSGSLPSESAFFSGSSAPKSSIESSRSTANFKPPDVLYTSTNKSSYTLVSSKSESTMQSIHSTGKPKFEAQESIFFPDRNLHPTNVASQAEAPSSSTANAQNSSYLITDTPHKNNPPIGSMRPTPSISHRSMFQTPQSSKFHQDYSKNHVQTPATILSTWSQRHMAKTPMQNRSTILPSDSGRNQAPPNFVNQHSTSASGSTPMQNRSTILPSDSGRNQANQHSSSASGSTPMQNRSTILPSDSGRNQANQHSSSASGSTHENPWYQNTEEKKVRRPLAETMQSSTNQKRLSQSEQSSNTQYSADSAAAASKHHDNPPENNPQRHGILENIKEQSTNKSGHQQHQTMHESKENRHPTPLIDKLAGKDEEQGKRDNFEGFKEAKRLSNNGNGNNDNRADSARHRSENNDASASRNARSCSSAPPKNTQNENVVEKNAAPNQQANVQVSIPSSIRRVNPGETIMVKGKEYLILGELGQGMSCHVLRVQDLTNLELRAIKVVDLTRMDKDSAQGCLQEISMLMKLQAPCVVRMFDFEFKPPMLHVVMEMGDTDFKSLLNSMTGEKRLPLTMILYYWTEMLTAVKHIHDNGVIHSDLKPANFLLVRGRLKLIDFGIASSMNADMTSVVKNTPIGTLNYISPEALMDIGGGGSDSPNQNVKYKINFKSDVWSLGCILYSLVFGYTPFNNFRTQWARIQAITNPNPKISFTLPAGVDPPPAILIDVLRKCLQHDPKARPTVAQLLQIPYITTKPNPQTPLREIPSNILLKIRHSLTDDEWQQFKEIMEQRRNES